MNSEHELIEIAKNILLEEFKTNDIIIEFQEEGDKFFIILEGQVAVYVPDYLEVSPQEREKRQKEANSYKDHITDLDRRIKRCLEREFMFSKMIKYLKEGLEESKDSFTSQSDSESTTNLPQINQNKDIRDGCVLLLQDSIKKMDYSQHNYHQLVSSQITSGTQSQMSNKSNRTRRNTKSTLNQMRSGSIIHQLNTAMKDSNKT